MDINIWSDVRCPFCYIGKRKFEMALNKFSHKEKVNVIWKSFELDPVITTNASLNPIEHFAERKGISIGEAEGMQQQVATIAKEVGLHFNSNNMVVANSFNAHRLIQLAKTKKLANELEEALFIAFFIDGKNIDNDEILLETGTSVGLAEKDVNKIFTSDNFSTEVREDEEEAQNLGINGVPFFVFNNKYAVSGAQSPETFLDVLEKSWDEFKKETPSLIISEGQSCSVEDNCM